MLVSLAAWLQNQGPEFGWLRVVVLPNPHHD